MDKAYNNIKHGYRTTQLPHLGSSDHVSLFLTPAYTPLRKKTPSIIKTVTTWPDGASQQLQDCFENTNWDIFRHQDLEEYTSTILYIQHCVETVTVNRRIRVFPNQKSWMTKQVQVLLKQRNIAFRAGEKALYSTARTNLKRGIREAKTAYKRKIEEHLNSNNPRQVWQGVQHITNFKSSNLTVADGDAQLAEELNHFFGRFEVKSPEVDTLQLPAPSSHILTVQAHEVRGILRAVNPRKAAGLDGVTGRVLRDCADQLAVVSQRYSTSPCPSAQSHPA